MRLAAIASPLLGTLLGGGGVFSGGGFSGGGGLGGVLVLPLEGLVGGGRRVIYQTPGLEEIENPTDGADVADERLAGLREGKLPGRVDGPGMVDDGVAVVLVKVRVFGRGARVEKLREESNLAVVDVVRREPAGVAGDVDDVGVGGGRRLRSTWCGGRRRVGVGGDW